jgi:hypothetical protein
MSDERNRSVDDDAIGHVFDQTNGVVAGLDGDSDGTAESDRLDLGARDRENATFDTAEVYGDDDGVADLRDPNP